MDDATCSNPLLTSSPHPLSSQTKTFANVFIAVVGAGVLGLPYTFMKTGWVAGSTMLFTISLLTYYCLMLLVYSRRRLEGNQACKIKSFGDLGYAVSGAPGRVVVDIMIVLSQAGFCASYLIFIANTLANMINHSDITVARIAGRRPITNFMGNLGIEPKTIYIWALFPFQLGLNSIKSLTHLAPLSIFADVVDIGAMGVVMVEDVQIYLEQSTTVYAFTTMSVFFYGVGVSIYAFEGIGMVLPLESEAANKDKFGMTLGLSMFLITLMYDLFGVLGYFAFGEDTRDIITMNLGSGLVTNTVQIGLCINLFFSFPIMMNPVHEVLERRFSAGEFSIWRRYTLVLGVVLVALFVPNFTDFLSLVGSSVCCILGLVLPAFFHLRAFKDDDLGMTWVVADVALIIIGIVFAISGTVSSLTEIISR